MAVPEDVDLDALNYVVKVPYNGTGATGGDPMTENLNMWYETGDIAWMITATALVLLMIPGVGFFYSGLARRKSALSLIWLSVMATAVTTFQWFFWGYSLTFSRTGGPFIGDLSNFGFRNVLAQPSVGSSRIPDLLFAVYQGMFSAITVALVTGAVAERGRLLPCVVFMFVWATLVYDPIACWTWNPHGWSNRMGSLDFAGGTPVHVTSGAAALAYSMVLGRRRGHGTHELNYRPHNVAHIVVGTVFLWVGWFGFNAGSALSANLRAVVAAVVTNLAACVGGITWCVLDYRLERKWSTVGFCSGVVAGLVAITPGSGYVPVWAAIPYGILGAGLANYATKLKFVLGIDDALDIFAVHGVGGLVGTVCTGVFASARVARLDGAGGGGVVGGWLDRNWAQLGYQLAASVSGLGYSFVATAAILLVVGRVPGLRLRAAEEDEIAGIDDAEVGEFAYDYVELEREVGADGGVVEAVSVLSSRDGGRSGGFGDPLAGGEEKICHHSALSRFV
ncbi:ammonium transporter AmtB-like domain-containing protein [Phialemonium atrogriseum]|uniref:Ammonium transporter n=1 Tax=Phialemonium atrogriseum TaxID=1093897 RepID=A0AAJ0C3K1_9PEZI|nr:ammonium transporter AmtB-like domain-containing protein [Phialemonium atrogriseum]KAK1769509.1 ammonium transporter AmtB-like domain-containing protein [Phialemonium atrogriseum]